MSKYFDLRDLFVFGGLALIGTGLYMVFEPSAYIVVGSCLFWLGVRKVAK